MPQSSLNTPRKSRKSKTSSEDPCTCPICGKSFVKLGLGQHKRSCQKKLDERRQDAVTEQQIKAELTYLQNSPIKVPTHKRVWENQDLFKESAKRRSAPSTARNQGRPVAAAGASTSRIPAPVPSTPSTDPPALDSIRTEYHPNSGRGARVELFEEYGQQEASNTSPPVVEAPWSPFSSRLDFEFAELALEAALTREQVERLLKLINQCAKHEDTLNISSYSDLRSTWDAASELLAPFTKITITPSHKGIDGSYEFWSRNLWDWAIEMVKNPLLAPHFVWDACRLSKYTRSCYVRFIHEPWTADRFWEVQSELPNNGKPLPFILYADKSKMSSFGSKMAYPIVARSGNLPSEIRNGKGLGGGRVVGWLPIVPEDEDEKGKKNFVDFKRVVWHESFRHLLASVKEYSATGCYVLCGDGVERLLFPFILILTSDYEEQCVMALIRGFQGLCPCPVCLAPKDKLGKETVWPLRNILETQNAVSNAQSGKKGSGEVLKRLGLRPVANAFWDIRFSDPFKAISWDRMHSYAHGLGGKHIWPLLHQCIEDRGAQESHRVDQQVEQLPRWRNFNHFDKIMGIHYSDATKYEHMLKLLLFTSHNVLERHNHAVGYHLLRVLRHYLVSDMYASLEVHSKDTMATGREALSRFLEIIQEFTELSSDTVNKNWDIPKNHTHQHLYDDIQAKGATRGYNTKYNENMHGPLRESYKRRTNFRDVEEQILRVDHWFHVAVHIRSQIEVLDEHAVKEEREREMELEGEDTSSHNMRKSRLSPLASGNAYLGSVQRTTTLHGVLEDRGDEPQFQNFGAHLAAFLKQEYGVNSIDPLLSITEYRFLKLSFESRVTSCTDVDYLRCTPRHFGKPRHDCVIVQAEGGIIFGQLVFLFSVSISNKSQPIALIQTFDRQYASARIRRKDSDLGFLRLRQRPEAQTQFVSVHAMIRGVPIFPAFDVAQDSLVFDVVDADMYLRVAEILQV